MGLGGGAFTTQNKILPGSYMNFVSLSRAAAAPDRGVVAIPLELDWGPDSEVFKITETEFRESSVRLLGYEYGNEKLRGLRDLFLNAKILYTYRLNSGGTRASCTFAEAKYTGPCGNSIKVIIQSNLDDITMYDVKTEYNGQVMDTQTVTSAAELVGNDFVEFKAGATLAATAGTPLAGGSNGVADGQAHQEFLDKIECYSFDTLALVSEDGILKNTYSNFCRRMRDERGIKFQTVLHQKAADYEGVINVRNVTTTEGWSAASLVYWVAGAVSNCAINKTALNTKYTGEFTVVASFTQAQLEQCINIGEFVVHKVGEELGVLADINSLVTVSPTKSASFKKNQVIRVIDTIARDIANLFNSKYLGSISNNESGRVSLWSDIVKHHNELQLVGAIEDFDETHVTIAPGNMKSSVVITDLITVASAMEQLYMTVMVA